ncbi:MAG TPA: hypothetical protein VGN54_13285, partial [Mycobacteriales bacterium]|nr:hypothetical protein [Mycobacteriales bacterium]
MPAHLNRDWTDRFRAPRWSLPSFARMRPERCALTGDVSGTWEVYSWSPGDAPVQLTARPHGTTHTAITPDGGEVWWFADTDGDEFGGWRRQAWGTAPGADQPGPAGLPAAYPAGLAFADDGSIAVGGSNEAGSTLWAIRPGGAPRVLYHHMQDAGIASISRDGRYVAISHSERGDNRHPAVRVLDFAGEAVADLDDGPGKGLHALGFLGDSAELLVAHERAGRAELLVWSP